MKPINIKSLQIGKTAQRVAAGESLAITAADGTVITATAITSIKSADVAFQKISSGKWIALDLRQDQVTSKNIIVSKHREKKQKTQEVTALQYDNVKGIVKFTNGKFYKGGDGAIVFLDQNIDKISGLANTGNGSLDYVAVWEKDNDLIFDKLGQTTTIQDWLLRIYVPFRESMNGSKFYGGIGIIDSNYKSSKNYTVWTTNNTVWNYVFSMSPNYDSNQLGNVPAPILTGTGSGYAYIPNINSSLGIVGLESYNSEYTYSPQVFLNFGEATASNYTSTQNLNISINGLSGTLAAEAESQQNLTIVVDDIAPLLNSTSVTFTASGYCNSGVAIKNSELASVAHFHSVMMMGDGFIITQESTKEIQITTNEEKVPVIFSPTRALTAFPEFGPLKFPTSSDWTTPSTLQYLKQIPYNPNTSYIFYNTNISSNIDINTASLFIPLWKKPDSTNVGDTFNITFADYLIAQGYEGSVEDAITESGKAMPYAAGSSNISLAVYNGATEYTITSVPNQEDTFNYISRQDNAAEINQFWDNLQNAVFDIFYEENGIRYILEASLSFEYIDVDLGIHVSRALTVVSGTIISKTKCSASLIPEYAFEYEIQAVAISQNNYWNYLKFAHTPGLWSFPGEITDNDIIASSVNAFLKNDNLMLAYTAPPALADITKDHKSYTELFTLLLDGRFIRLGETESNVSAMALGIPSSVGLWSYYED